MTSTSIYSVVPVSQSKTEIFISKAILVHGDLYNYDSVEYTHNKTKIKIECKVHGIFEQIPNNHLSGNGCSKCNKKLSRKSLTSNIKDVIIKAIDVHGELYDYSQIDYVNTHTKVKIICKIHGMFKQTPANHLSGQGCDKCKHIISKISTKWLESLNISDLIFEYRLPENLRKAVDGYSPSTNTVYQFHGDYWHGNPVKFNGEDINPSSKKSYGELYRKTIESDLWIQSLGYNLVTIWESDFTK